MLLISESRHNGKVCQDWDYKHNKKLSETILAEKNRYIDLRNRASLEGSKAVAEIMSKQTVPFI